MGRPISDHLPSRQPGEPRPEEKKVVEEKKPVIAETERHEPPKNIEEIVRNSIPLENKIKTREAEVPFKKKKRR